MVVFQVPVADFQLFEEEPGCRHPKLFKKARKGMENRPSSAKNRDERFNSENVQSSSYFGGSFFKNYRL